jgi:hypothetical protein
MVQANVLCKCGPFLQVAREQLLRGQRSIPFKLCVKKCEPNVDRLCERSVLLSCLNSECLHVKMAAMHKDTYLGA